MPLDHGGLIDPPANDAVDPALERSVARVIRQHLSLGEAFALFVVAVLAFIGVPAERSVPTPPPVAALGTSPDPAAN